jgi:glutathionylspermidine synthase
MRRHTITPRPDWQRTVEEQGLIYPLTRHPDDSLRPYWDESAYYSFTLDEVEALEETVEELHRMCLAAADHIVTAGRFADLGVTDPRVADAVAEAWHRRAELPSVYGRFDLRYDGTGPAKLLEYNADTPTSIFEAAVFQWTWLEQSIERRAIPGEADQFNSIHERLIDAWKPLGLGCHLHLAGTMENEEDAGTLAYLQDTAVQAGLVTTTLDIEEIGWREAGGGGFVDLDGRDIALAFKLYPWEWMFHDAFGARLMDAQTRWIEPPWKAVLSNKGILPLLWEMFPGHPNLLPAYFEDDPRATELGTSYVRKPLYSREGANVTIVSGSAPLAAQDGPYGSEGFIRQALATVRDFDRQYPVIGSWLVDHAPCGLSIREDAGPITGNNSRFLPHAIL